MAGVNVVYIVGYAGREPETVFLPSGVTIANINVATTQQWTDKKTGQKQARTEWHRCVAFGRLAEIATLIVKKGTLLYISGYLRTDRYTDKDGVNRWATKIIVEKLTALARPTAKPAQDSTPEQDVAPEQTGLPIDEPIDQPVDPPVEAEEQNWSTSSTDDDEIPF